MDLLLSRVEKYYRVIFMDHSNKKIQQEGGNLKCLSPIFYPKFPINKRRKKPKGRFFLRKESIELQIERRAKEGLRE